MPEIPARVQIMLDHPGVYICGDVEHPGMKTIVVSTGNHLFAVQVAHELDPTRFTPTFTMHGPYGDEPPTTDDRYYAGRASMLNDVVAKLKEYDAARSAQIAAGIPVMPDPGPPSDIIRVH